MFTYWTVLESGKGRYTALELWIYEQYPLQKDSSVKDQMLLTPSTHEEGDRSLMGNPSAISTHQIDS